MNLFNRNKGRKKGLSQKENFKKNMKTTFLNYFKFYNVKQKMNLGKVIC